MDNQCDCIVYVFAIRTAKLSCAAIHDGHDFTSARAVSIILTSASSRSSGVQLCSSFRWRQ